MKLTTNYVVYLNADNKVQCAKCRLTGRFVKRVIAQLEYEKEYGFFAFSTLSMLVILFTVHFSNVMSKVILAWDYQDAKKKARDYLNVKRLPNDYRLSQIYGKIAEVMSVDIK